MSARRTKLTPEQHDAEPPISRNARRPIRVRLGADGYRRLVSGTQILARNGAGPNVFLTADRKILKRFQPRRLLSSYWIDPYVYRFVRATRDLAAAGFVTVDVQRIYCLGLRRGHEDYSRELFESCAAVVTDDAGKRSSLLRLYLNAAAEAGDPTAEILAHHLEIIADTCKRHGAQVLTLVAKMMDDSMSCF